MSWVAAAVVGSTLAGGLISADASKSAANTQAGAAANATAEQAREFDAEQAALAPYRDLGTAALPTLRTALGLPGGDTSSSTYGTLTKPFSFDVTQDPGYQFRLGQGEQAVENSAAAKGTQLSGATLKELLKYGQDYASGEFNNAFQRDQATKQQIYGMLSGAVGVGSGATTTQVQAGQNTAANIGNNIIGAGNASAAGQVGVANAVSGALTGSTNSVMDYTLLRNLINKNNTVSPIVGGVNLSGSATPALPEP